MYMVWIGVKDLEHPWFELVYRWISMTFGWTSDLVTQSIAKSSSHLVHHHMWLGGPSLWINWFTGQVKASNLQSLDVRPLRAGSSGSRAWKDEGSKSWSPLTPDVEAVEVHFFLLAFTLPALPNSFFWMRIPQWESQASSSMAALTAFEARRAPWNLNPSWNSWDLYGYRMATVWLPYGMK